MADQGTSPLVRAMDNLLGTNITLADACVGGFIGIASWMVLEQIYIFVATLRAKHPITLSRLVDGIVRAKALDEEGFYKCDDAPADVQTLRRKGLDALEKRYREKYEGSIKEDNKLITGMSDMRFTDTNRVPPQFQVWA